ncbi:MAG: hypothetical protein HYT08_00340 [Candidatus Levybacteria bacterium]|nr:hypothetical protein [Candidatus Levybacteria bacterium]
MKTYLILGIIAAIVLSGGFFLLNGQSKNDPLSQDTTSVQGVTEEKNEDSMMGTGYILKDGKMMIEKNHELRPMTKDATLNDGTVVKITEKY